MNANALGCQEASTHEMTYLEGVAEAPQKGGKLCFPYY